MNSGYKLLPTDDDRLQLIFDEPLHAPTALQMAPSTTESQLRSGDWLVLAFAVWTLESRPSIETACRLALGQSEYNVAVRPFEVLEEFASWSQLTYTETGYLQVESTGTNIAISQPNAPTTLWLLFRDGSHFATLPEATTGEEVHDFAVSHGVRLGQV